MSRMMTLIQCGVAITLSLFLSLTTAQADTVKPGITLQTEQHSVFLGDSIIIDVESIGLIEPLNTSSLFKGADLLRETTGTRIAVIEGKVVEVRIRHMEFIPKKEGQLFFGPLTGETIHGETVSNTLVVEVLPPADINWQPQATDLTASITLSINNQTIDTETINNTRLVSELYVGQHLSVDIELKHRYPISEEKIQLPLFEGFSLYKQHEERRTIETAADGSSMRVTAWKFHLFAERSGPMVIDNLEWSGTAIRSRTQRAKFTRSTSPINFDIRPANIDTTWWLPSQHVELKDSWSRDPRELTAGDEILRTITLTARNVLAHQLPTIEPLESRAITSTLIKQDRQQQLTGDTITSTAEFTFRMVAQSPIPVFLDTVRVQWFDVIAQQQKEAIIPARRINIGLPDRADLLNAVSFSDQWWERYLFALRGHAASHYIWYFSLPFMLMLIMILFFKEWKSRREIKRSVYELNKNVVLPSI